MKKLKKVSAKPLEEGKSQVIALVLVLLVGALGIHRVYLGYVGIGIIQLLTLGGCGLFNY
ncbi:MAG: NINE protein [Bacteroidota bacterium]